MRERWVIGELKKKKKKKMIVREGEKDREEQEEVRKTSYTHDLGPFLEQG